ncbi:MAG TPA: DUF362 domain-containing protein [Thermodesulfobacteriota bacterium]|nr:DUF362 domain-containing protein [Thermodesulfobacteriota bacterium]
MQKPVVSVVKAGEDVELAVRKAVTLAGGLEGVVSSKSRVLIKPNVASQDRSGIGRITDARVTQAVTKMVLERNPKSVVIGEGSAVGFDFPELHDTMTALKESGTKEVAEKLGVALVDLNTDDHEEVEISQPLVMKSVKIAQTALDSNVIISIPVMKTHIRSAVTISLKNMKGAMPGQEKKKTHQLGLELAIADLNSVIKPHFAVVDGLVGMEGLWEYPDDCVTLGLVGAGRDPVAVDAIFAQIMGVLPQEIMHLQYCQIKGLGIANPEKIEVAGLPISEVRRPFRPAFEVLRNRYPGLTVLAEKSCTGCTSEFISTLIYIREAQQVEKLNGLTVIMGEGTEDFRGEKAVVIGKCARKGKEHLAFVPGCPPAVDDITQKVCEVCDIDVQLVSRKRDELHQMTTGKSLR